MANPEGLVGVYAGMLLLIFAMSKMATGNYIPPYFSYFIVAFIMFAAVSVFAVGPVEVSSLWARFLHFSDDIMWAMNGKRPFNFDDIVDSIFLGRQPRDLKDVADIEKHGIKRFIIMNEEWELCVETIQLERRSIKTLVLKTPDFAAPSLENMISGVEFLEESVARNEAVYVHCNGGKGRSSVVVIAYVMKNKGMTKEQAYDFVKGKRKIANMKKFGGWMPQWRCLTNYEKWLNRQRKKI